LRVIAVSIDAELLIKFLKGSGPQYLPFWIQLCSVMAHNALPNVFSIHVYTMILALAIKLS